MLRCLCVCVLLLLRVSLPTNRADAADDRYVVLISVDGLAATYFDDRHTAMPTLRRLAKEGAHAKGMLTSFPSVTWPSHVSLITGASPARHGVIGNSTLDRRTLGTIRYIGDPVFTKAECVRVPTLYDAVSKAGMKTASVIWPACNGATTLNWMIPDSNQEAIHRKYTTPGFAAELDEAGISIAKLGRWGWNKEHSAARDATYTRVAKHLLKKHQPNLLLLHLITPDGVEHTYGPHVEESRWAVSNSDDRIREIVEALEQPPFAGKSTLFVVSDHGFAEYDKVIHPNVLLVQNGLVTVGKKGSIEKRQAWCHASGGACQVYILDTNNKETIRKSLKSMLGKLEGVERVLDVADFMKYGLPDPRENPEQADLMLSAKPGYTFGGSHTGKEVIRDAGSRKGSHGHLPDPRYMHATFLAYGAGIKPGVKLKLISNLDVAPTIAHLLGVKLPTAEGRVLTEILTDAD